MSDMVSIAVGGTQMDVYIDCPASGAPWPAIVLTYHREGIDDFTKFVARQYAQAGYLVAVPEVSHRILSVPLHDRKNHLKDSEIVADIAAAVAYLKTRADVAAARLAIAGHCMGGHMLFLAAAALPDFACMVACYPTGLFECWGGEGATPFEQLSKIRCPVIGFFGNEDRNPSPQDADRLDAALTRLGKEHEFHRYDGAGHGFQRPTRSEPAIRATQDDSWQRIFAFLTAKLAVPAGESP
jgi:carboxymethylenebutenolidase